MITRQEGRFSGLRARRESDPMFDDYGIEILPDPPDNLDFLELPEDFQDRVADRLERGIALGLARDNAARRAHTEQVHAMRTRRGAAAAREKSRHLAEQTRRRANKASLGERAGTREALSAAYLAAHRAENSGSGK